MSGDAITEVSAIVVADDFFRPAHQIVYETVIAMREHKDVVDALTVKARLEADGTLARVGGATYLHTLLQAPPTAANAGYYAARLLELAERRELLRSAKRLEQKAADPAVSLTDLRSLVQQAAEDSTSRRDGHARGPAVAALRVTPVAQIKVKATEWLWTNRIPLGALTLLPRP